MALGIQIAILKAQQQINEDQEELSTTPPPSPQQTAVLLTQVTTAENALNSMIPQQQSFARETGIDYSKLTTPSDLTKQLQQLQGKIPNDLYTELSNGISELGKPT